MASNTGGIGYQGYSGGIGSQGSSLTWSASGGHSIPFTGNIGYTWNTGYSGGMGYQGAFKEPEEEYRIVEKFIWKPTKLDNKWKWLVKCYVKQSRWVNTYSSSSWKDVEFLTPTEYLEWRIIYE